MHQIYQELVDSCFSWILILLLMFLEKLSDRIIDFYCISSTVILINQW